MNENPITYELSEQKKEMLDTPGHILMLGGPGSGKTTMALRKARRVIERDGIQIDQHVLFLSFARATIFRVEQQAGIDITDSIRNHLEINTYHGFTWNLLKSHGYLVTSKTPIRILPPPEAASRLADIEGIEAKENEKHRLLKEEGQFHFDLFAWLSTELLTRSKALAEIVSDAYPVIILDEFQDTNSDEWKLVQVLGERSRLVALADAEQRIYEFRGADPARIGEFITAFNPTQFDFGTENNRSNGTDIVRFGNDILTSANKKKRYNDVQCVGYPFRRGKGIHQYLKYAVLDAIKRLKDVGGGKWSLAILVPTNKLMLEISYYLETEQRFSNGQRLPVINHEVALETAGPSLAAVLIAGLLEGGDGNEDNSKRLICNLCEHIRGRKGDKPPSKAHLKLTYALINYIETGIIRGKTRQLVVNECLRIAGNCKRLAFSGNPDADWLQVRKSLFEVNCDVINQVAIDARYLRLLHKGSILRSNLDNLWRNNGNYSGAAAAVKGALLQEHFSASTKVWKGIHVMTIHKAKGKEFDEVIIYEGYRQGKIIRPNSNQREREQARLALRVAVTRAMKRTTILTPRNDACSFLC